MLNVRGQFLPVQHIGGKLGIEGAQTDPAQAVLIVVESETAGHSVLMVDAIKDQRQVVIKSLETNFQQIPGVRSEKHTSEIQSLMRSSYAVFCLKKKKTYSQNTKVKQKT